MLFCRRGKIVDEIFLPTPNPSGLAFGGSDFDKLFVITGTHSSNLETGELESVDNNAPAGQLLMITGLGDKGIPVRKACCAC